MQTSFFSWVNKLQGTASWTINIAPSEIDGNIVVSVLFSHPICTAQGVQLVPLIFNETPKKMGETFFETLLNPAALANELFVKNDQDFKKSLEKATKKLSENVKSNSTVTKPNNTVDRKKEYEQAIAKIDELRAKCKYNEAIELLPSVEDHPNKEAELNKLRKELETNAKQLELL